VGMKSKESKVKGCADFLRYARSSADF
jgi:hypothetical protein